MQLTCEVCRAPLREEDVRLDLAVASCHSCNAVYDLSGRKARGLVEALPRRPAARPRAVLPERFTFDDEGPVTRITWRWRSSLDKNLVIVCLIWNGIWIMGALSGKFPLEEGPVASFLSALFSVGGGLFLAYLTLAGVLNHTRIEVSRDRLSIRHGPLPWRGNRVLPGRQLVQLYGEEIQGENETTYCLYALDREGRRLKLISDLPEKHQVLYLEQALERQLGIEDAPVEGEVAQRAEGA